MSDAAPNKIVLHGRKVVGGIAEGEALVTNGRRSPAGAASTSATAR